jgi:restriction system protein
LLGLLALTGGLGWAQPELMQLQGLSREELLHQLGPPGSRAIAGGREVLTFPQARVTLQEGVVIEVVPLAQSAAAARLAVSPAAPSASAVSPPPAPVVRLETAAPEPAGEKPPRRSPFVRLVTTAVLLVVVAGGAAAWRVWRRRRPVVTRAGAVATSAPAPEEDGIEPVPALPVRDRTALDAALLDELEWKCFEQLVAAYFGARGRDARLTPPGADGGVDIYLHGNGAARPTALVQCKSWHAREVGVRTVRELYGVMVAEGVMEAFLVTTGSFSEGAHAFAEGKNLHLLDGAAFLAAFNALPEPDRRRILTTVTEGDYTTPSCPSCDVKLVRRGEGSSFWGCPRFPRCRYTLSARSRP